MITHAGTRLDRTSEALKTNQIGEEDARQAQDRQCAATRLESERWEGKRKEVQQFALHSPFHPKYWPKHQPEQRVEVLRHVIRTHWQYFSPSGVKDGPRVDLRHLLQNTVWETWFNSLMRACTPVVGQVCRGDSEEMLLEEQHDQLKARANSMHLSLNAKEYPSPGGVPIWLRACQRTAPLGDVLEGLRGVRGVEDSVLVVTIDRDKSEAVLRALLAVDFMQVCALERCRR